jgi:hypothetical protein
MQGVYFARNLRHRKLQRALMRFITPDNYFEVRKALEPARRTGLIGGCDYSETLSFISSTRWLTACASSLSQAAGAPLASFCSRRLASCVPAYSRTASARSTRSGSGALAAPPAKFLALRPLCSRILPSDSLIAFAHA